MNKAGKILCVSAFVVVLCAVIILYVVPFYKPLEITGVFVPYRYIVYGDHAEIEEYIGRGEDVVIPKRLLGHTVTRIENDSFDYSTMKRVVIPDCVEEIGLGAFWECENLEEVKLPAGLKELNGDTFTECNSLRSIELPQQLEAIYHSAFWGCSSLIRIDIPPSVNTIGPEVFFECTNLEEIIIPGNVQKIDGNTFEGTPWLEGQTEEFVVAGNNVLIKYNGSDSVIEVPEGITYIGHGLFWSDAYCEDMVITKVVLPESVTEVGRLAFSNRPSLEYIVLKNENVILDEDFIRCCENVTIVSAEGSTGQKYAEENGLKWMELEE